MERQSRLRHSAMKKDGPFNGHICKTDNSLGFNSPVLIGFVFITQHKMMGNVKSGFDWNPQSLLITSGMSKKRQVAGLELAVHGPIAQVEGRC